MTFQITRRHDTENGIGAGNGTGTEAETDALEDFKCFRTESLYAHVQPVLTS